MIRTRCARKLPAHLAESGQKVAAIAAYQRAAGAAKDLHASEEAIRLFRRRLGSRAAAGESGPAPLRSLS